MCGRYRMTRADKLAQQFEATEFDGPEVEVELAPRYNVAPGQMIVAVRQHREKPVRRLSRLKWGLVPFWAKDPNIGYKMINARSETIVDKPAYREAFKNRRCLIPADGFYEWKTEGKSKHPFHFGMKDDSIFAFAGIWEFWKDPKGAVLETCSILTTGPNAVMEGVHDRMPVILRPDDYELWLDPGFKKTDALADLLKPYDANQMKRYEVSTRVNSVKYDDADCAAALETGHLFQ
jgi:putative SOS response-associated peptidase YedK